MKNLRFITLTVLLLMVVGVVPLYSQSSGSSGAMRVNIPFQFIVGQEKFPAGDYLVTPLFENSIKIESLDRRGTAIVLTAATGGGAKVQGPKLIFNSYGNRLFLSEIWLHSSASGRQLFASAKEVELARALPQERTTIMASK